jgi:hypothetical protein
MPALADHNSFRSNIMETTNQIPQGFEASKMSILKYIRSISLNHFCISL